MIFSKFFKAQWQSKDSNVRIAAINNDLKLDNPEHKKIILQLIEQDKHELVRRAALLKINDFNTWLNAGKNNNNKKVREFAQKQTENILHDKHDIKLSIADKLQYINDLSSTAGLETWLQQEQNEDIIICLYEKIAKPQLIQTLFTQKQQANVQKYLLNGIETKELLDKLLKKACNEEVSTLISNKLTYLLDLTEKPKKLTKQVQLLLSKLLALTDVPDYKVMNDKRVVLESEWQLHLSEFYCFTEIDQVTFKEKYQTISTQIDKIFAKKAENYQQSILADKLKQEKALVCKDFDQSIATLSQTLTTAIFENTEINEQAYKTELDSLENIVSTSVLNDKEKIHYQNLIQSQLNKITQLPVISQSISEATLLISKISQLTLPTTISELNERQPLFDDWLKQWRVVENKASGILPESIKSAYKEIDQHWRKGLSPLIKEQKSLLIQSHKKVADLNRLISSGKYNAAFGVFKHFEKLYLQLSDTQKLRLQKDYDNINEKIAELSDWEHYIATPRKHKLLEDIKALVLVPLDNPNEQAARVKAFRKTWNTLGHADDDVERALNDEFNHCCEQAFAPCRLFYAEQEKLREQQLEVRFTIIEQTKSLVNQLDKDPIDWKSLDGQLNKLQQKWQDAGEVDKTKYKELHQQFNNSLKPVKNAIKQFHDENIKNKQLLIEMAQKELDNENISDAINNIKSLQSKWRNVGYCGARDENKLWQTFRNINDTFFKKRDELKELEKSQQLVQQGVFEEKLFALKHQLTSKTDLSLLQSTILLAQELLTVVVNTSPKAPSMVSAIETYIKELEKAVNKVHQQQIKQDWENLFSLLEEIAKGSLQSIDLMDNELFNKLSIGWQKKISDITTKQVTDNRSEKTLELEIFAGIESPVEFKQERMQVQVGLIQQQITSATEIDLQASFISWLQLGKFTVDDLPLISRIKPIYCN